MIINPLSRCINSIPVQPGVSLRDTVKQSYSSGDILTLGADTQNVYTMYTSAGLYAYSVSADSTMQTDDQKWEAITAKYRSSIMKIDDYDKMLDDLASAGLITAAEKALASENARAVINEKRYTWDMKDGQLGCGSIPAFLNIVHFDELLTNISAANDTEFESSRNSFLKQFYTKAKSAEMTNEEKWESVLNRYKSKPLSLDDFGQLLCDLANYSLITPEECFGTYSHASAVVDDKMTLYDMQDGDLGNDIIPYSLTLIDFDELMAELSNPNRVYKGDESRDPRLIFMDFYNKYSNYFQKFKLNKGEYK